MKIRLECHCGANMEADSGAFINSGGTPDEKGRVFQVEKLADEWLKTHSCFLKA